MDKKGYKEKERKNTKKKSITPRMESTRQYMNENKDSSPRLRKNRKKPLK